MNKDSLEHLSSLMDGELSHETSLFVAKRMGSDDALGKTWSRYHLVRECLRRPGGKWALAGLALNLDGIEADVARPEPARAGAPRWLRAVSGFAIAASVAVVSVMVALPPTVDENGETATANEPFTSPNPLSAVPVSQPASYSGSARAANQRLNTYLIRHNQVAGAAGRQGFVSFMPIVTAAPVQPMDAAEKPQDEAKVESTSEQSEQP